MHFQGFFWWGLHLVLWYILPSVISLLSKGLNKWGGYFSPSVVVLVWALSYIGHALLFFEVKSLLKFICCTTTDDSALHNFFLFFFLQSARCAANCLQHACLWRWGTVICKSHTTHMGTDCMWRVSCCARGQLNYVLTRVEKAFHFSYVSLAETIELWRKEETRVTGENPWWGAHKKCHILKSENSSLGQHSNLHFSIGGRRLLGKQKSWLNHYTSLTIDLWRCKDSHSAWRKPSGRALEIPY